MKAYIVIMLSLFAIQVQSQQQNIDYISIIDDLFYMEEAKARMEVYKNGELMKFYELDFYRHDHKVRMDFTGPAVEKGRRMLDDETNIWMYMPRTSKVIKIPLKQTFMGSDASNRDVFRLNFGRDYQLQNVADAKDNSLEIELKAKDESVAYSKVIITFDTDKNTPTKQEMYTLSGKRIKTIEYAEYTIFEGKYVPSFMLIKDELQKNTYTTLSYHSFKMKSGKPAEFFTLGGIKR